MENKFQLSAEQMIEDQKRYAIPTRDLSDLPYVDIKSEEDFDKIPNTGGAYWIVTDEPIGHAMNKYEDQRVKLNVGEVIYNGMASGNVRGRVKSHLYRVKDGGWSAISVDIIPGVAGSHTKLLLHSNKRKKLAYFNGEKATSIDQIPISFYSEANQKNIELSLKNPKNKEGNLWYRSGINALDENHSKYNWRVYYLTGLPQSYADFVEREWRLTNGTPRLNSYKTGR